MKSRYYLMLLIFVVAVMSCRLGGVRGSGDIEVEERSIEAFTELEASGAFEILVESGHEPNLKIRAEDNLLKYIETENYGDKLVIDTDRNLNPRKDIKIRITTSGLKNIDASGANEIIAKYIDAENFYLDLSGASEVKLSGKVVRISIDASGASEINTKELKADGVKIDASGAVEAVVYASKFLDADVSGAGSIEFYGGAQNVKTDISGAGSVKRVGV